MLPVSLCAVSSGLLTLVQLTSHITSIASKMEAMEARIEHDTTSRLAKLEDKINQIHDVLCGGANNTVRSVSPDPPRPRELSKKPPMNLAPISQPQSPLNSPLIEPKRDPLVGALKTDSEEPTEMSSDVSQ